MKTSNRVILIIAIIFFVAILAAAMIVRLRFYQQVTNRSIWHSYSLHFGRATAGKSNIGSMSYKLPAFNTISFAGNANVVIHQGPHSHIVISAEKTSLSNIDVNVRDNVLAIASLKNVELIRAATPTITITTPNLKAINAGGVYHFKADDLKVKDLTLHLAGAGDLKLSGKTNNFVIKVGGMVHVLAKNLIAKNVVIKMAGTGLAIVHASNSINIKSAGMTEVKYYGNPLHVSQKQVGGRVVHMQ